MRRLLVPLLAAAACLLAAVPAGAVIRVQKGMAGVRIGMTQGQMRDALGSPRKTQQGSNDFGAYTDFVYPGRIKITFQGNRRVTSIYTSGRGQRTTRRVGVGSRERTVATKVPGAVCESISRARVCHVGDFAAGRRVTVFSIRDGRVATVTIGTVID